MLVQQIHLNIQILPIFGTGTIVETLHNKIIIAISKLVLEWCECETLTGYYAFNL